MYMCTKLTHGYNFVARLCLWGTDLSQGQYTAAWYRWYNFVARLCLWGTDLSQGQYTAAWYRWYNFVAMLCLWGTDMSQGQYTAAWWLELCGQGRSVGHRLASGRSICGGLMLPGFSRSFQQGVGVLQNLKKIADIYYVQFARIVIYHHPWCLLEAALKVTERTHTASGSHKRSIYHAHRRWWKSLVKG